MATENVIMLSNVRLSFPKLAEPQRTTNAQTGKERISYEAEFIMPADHPGFQKAMKVVGQMAVDKWKDHAPNVLQMVNQDQKKRGFGNGSEKINTKTFKVYDGYEGNVFISARRDTRPQIIGPDGNPIDPNNTMAVMDAAKRLYGGCRVNAAIKPWLQDNTHGRGVRFDLIAVQFYQDDQPFGEGAVDVSGLFGAAPAPTTAMPSPAGMPAFGAAPAPTTVMPAPPSFGAPGMPSFLS